MKYVTQEEFNELVKEEVKKNEMRELSSSEERDPETIPNVAYYVDLLNKEYSREKPRVVKPKEKEVKHERKAVKVQPRAGKRNR